MQRALILSATLAAAGCSSTPEMPPVFSESFITNITPQGNHFFTYNATLNMQQGGGSGGAGGRPGGGKGAPRGGRSDGPGGGMGGAPGGGTGSAPGGTTPQKMRGNPEKTAMERVEKIVADTGYCNNGWFVIEKTIDRGSAEIRGECRTASG